MLNYEVDPAVLRPHLPAGTELDLWDGTPLLSIVGFLFQDTRVLGVSMPLHRDFEEVNLRFYVRRRANGDWRRGVVFLKEIVPRRAIALLARRVYGEPYVAMPMRHSITNPGDSVEQRGAVEYAWRHKRRWNRLWVRMAGAAELPGPGSEEQFITEHFWGYTARSDGGCLEYQVEHPSWRVWRATETGLECAIEEVYGRQFAAPLGSRPRSAFVAEGSAVIVRRGRRV